MTIWTATERPMVFALTVFNRQIIDACDPPPHQAFRVELPIFVSVAAEPVIGIVVPFIGKPHSDPIVAKCPHLFNQSINMFQRHVVLSEQTRLGAETSDLASKVFRQGQMTSETSTPEKATGKIPELLLYLANFLGSFGEKLRAGEVIMCGSTVVPLRIESNETVVHALDPIGEVQVTFDRHRQSQSRN
jgi:hypothetical protein